MTSGWGYELFGQRQFRTVWTANLVFNLGLVMLSLGAAWTMTSLTDSPVLVSMVQTMSSLPFVLFAIPLGIATDAVGHRTMMIVSQIWMLAMTGLLGVVALPGGGDVTPKWLLVLVFLVGIGVVVQQASWKPFLYELRLPDGLLRSPRGALHQRGVTPLHDHRVEDHPEQMLRLSRRRRRG